MTFIASGYDADTSNRMVVAVEHSTLLKARECIQRDNPNMIIEDCHAVHQAETPE